MIELLFTRHYIEIKSFDTDSIIMKFTPIKKETVSIKSINKHYILFSAN